MPDNRLFTRKARRPWWMGRPLDWRTWRSILITTVLLWIPLMLLRSCS